MLTSQEQVSRRIRRQHIPTQWRLNGDYGVPIDIMTLMGTPYFDYWFDSRNIQRLRICDPWGVCWDLF